MSLDTPVFKFNNIYDFSASFQENIKSFQNHYSEKFNKIKDLPILKLTSSNINVSLDIIRSNIFDINFSNYNSSLTFDNYQLKDVIKTYKWIIDKVTSPITSIIYLFNNKTNNLSPEYTNRQNNKLISDLLNEIKPENDFLEILDIYISEYMNVPKSSNNIINFIYFIRRFPLIRFLLNKYLYENEYEYFMKIRENKLDNINYLLYIKEDIKTREFNELKKTGLYNFDRNYVLGYHDSLRNQTNPYYVFDDTYNNMFLNNCNGCINKDYKKYNAISSIENKNKIEDIIFIFPFLYNMSELFILKDRITQVLRRIRDMYYCIDSVNDKIYLKNLNRLITTLRDRNRFHNLIDVNTSFELFSIERTDIILKQFILFFSYDLILNRIDIDNVFRNLEIEELLIRLSTFIINLYGIYQRGDLNIDENDFLKSIEYYDEEGNVIEEEEQDIAINDFEANYRYVTEVLIPKNAKNLSYFYLFASYTLFKNIKFKKYVEDDLFKMSHLFYIFNYFNNDARELYPLFLFGSFSDGKNKWIKSYDYKKNFFLEWLIEYYDESFNNVDKFVLD